MCRNQEIRIKLKKEEKDKIESLAKAIGLEPSVYVRMVSLNSKLIVESIK